MKEIKKVQSICPVCLSPLEASYVQSEGQVLLVKECKKHGTFSSYICGDSNEFSDWISRPSTSVTPKHHTTKGASALKGSTECPLHCGLCDNHLQTACCVLIEVTKRCNQHCPYCYARSENSVSGDPDIYEIDRKYELLLKLGEERPFNIQLSGGEPTVRNDLPELIRLGKAKGFEYIQINTNGRRIALEEGYANQLKEAGASVIFLQFDGTTDDIYEALRGEPLSAIKEKSVENCRKARLPVTLVPTVVKTINLSDIGSMLNFLLKNVDVVKGIHFQPVSFFGRYPDSLYRNGDFRNRVTMFDILHEIERQTEGVFKYANFRPLAIGNPLCGFHGTFQKMGDGSVRLLTEDAVCCIKSEPLKAVEQLRGFVLNKWDIPDMDRRCDCKSQEPMNFDQFLIETKSTMFTVTGMPFQDIGNLDAERLKRCRVHVLSPDDRLIPFCAYNSLYREGIKPSEKRRDNDE